VAAGLIEYFLLRIALFKIRLFPFAARVFVKLIDLAMPRYRKIAIKNLTMAGFHEPGRIVNGMFASLARVVATFARFPGLDKSNIDRYIRYDGLENFEAARAHGKGVLIATAHFGNWELSAFAHALMTAPMNIVVRPLDNVRVDALVERYRALSGNRIITKRDAARDILRALKNGEAVGILIDQNTTLDEGVFIDFFGTKACAGSAFVKLAHHGGAAVVPGYALWSSAEKRYVLRFDPHIPMSGDVLADTQEVHSHLESVIRKHPEQYLWIHRRWKTRPPGEAPIY
jgi:KDO2-lipid IV(A) lauroyltransferase